MYRSYAVASSGDSEHRSLHYTSTKTIDFIILPTFHVQIPCQSKDTSAALEDYHQSQIHTGVQKSNESLP